MPITTIITSVLSNIGKDENGIPARYSGPGLTWNRVNTASMKKEKAMEKENSILVPPVPVRKANE
jgi:hypothetical protein